MTGTPPGGTFDIADVVSATISADDGAGGSSTAAQIVLASTSGLCADAAATPPIDRKNERYIIIQLRDVAGAMSTAPTAPGTYTIYPDTGSQPPKSASFVTGGFDASCASNDEVAAAAHAGTVTLTSIAGGVYAGSFDVTLDTDAHLTGSFTPTACPALQAASTQALHLCN